MELVRVKGWKYMYSEELEMEIAVNEVTGLVWCQDGTKYTRNEIETIKKNHRKINKPVHMIKKMFDGTIIL